MVLTGGSIQGSISVRDGELAGLRSEINQLASTLISEVNAVHSAGFGPDGTTGANFFTGTTAADIAVNSAIVTNPRLFQASGVAGESGNNTVAQAIAALNQKTHA